VLILGLAIIYWIWPTRKPYQNTQIDEQQLEVIDKHKDEEFKTAQQPPVEQKQKPPDIPFVKNDVNKESVEESPFRKPSLRPSHQYLNRINSLALRYKKIPIEEILPILEPYKGLLDAKEKALFGPFRGILQDDPQNRRIRVNFSYTRPDYGFSKGSCVAIASANIEAYGTIRKGNLRILRSNEPGYLVFVIDKKYFLEIFQTTIFDTRKYRASLSIKGEPNKYEITLESMHNWENRLTCEDI